MTVIFDFLQGSCTILTYKDFNKKRGLFGRNLKVLEGLKEAKIEANFPAKPAPGGEVALDGVETPFLALNQGRMCLV